MKNKAIITLLFLASAFSMYGQLPQAFSFQGVAFDPGGNPVENAAIAVRTGILIDGNKPLKVIIE